MTKPEISLFFPVYKDEATIVEVAEKSLSVLSELSSRFEIIIVNDGSPDCCGQIALDLAKKYDCIRVVQHPVNLGYGAAIRSGLANCRYEWICFLDGDDEYDAYDLHKLIVLKDFYDLIVTFRYVKRYSSFRIFISWVYNVILRYLFRTRFRDISTGLRLVRRSLIASLDLRASSPFIGAELAIKTMLKGYRVGEVGIQTFPRKFGRGSATSWRNILATIRDMMWTYRVIFSVNYEPPPTHGSKSAGEAEKEPKRAA